jgi:FixJ family two-component response regulator
MDISRAIQSAVLVVDDDQGTRDTVRAALSIEGFAVFTATSAAEGFDLVQRTIPDFMFVDFRLTDCSGLDLVRRLMDSHSCFPFVLMSAFLTTRITVDAMRLGAIDVLEKPIEVGAIVDIAKANRRSRRVPKAASDRSGFQQRSFAERPKSIAERWASWVVRAMEASGDLKTIDEWARFVGVSYSALCETCRLVNIRPHDARDFMRLLRAVIGGRGVRRPEYFLDVGDARTMKTLLTRGGFNSSSDKWRIDDFFERQTFIDSANDGLRLLKARYSRTP